MEKDLKFLEEELTREKDPETKLYLEKAVKKGREAIIGYNEELVARNLKRAKWPSYDDLATSGRNRLASCADNINQNDSLQSKKGTGD